MLAIQDVGRVAGDHRSAVGRHDDIGPPIVPRSLRHRTGIDQLGRSPVQHHAATRRQILRQRGGKSRRAARGEDLADRSERGIDQGSGTEI